MCDCPCDCWRSKPVRQRITNTFIHADIFNQQPSNPLNVKCQPRPGQPHQCKCSNVWQKPVLKDTRYRPLDHPNEYFYQQHLAGGSGCGCCAGGNRGNRENEECKVGNGDQGKKSLYYFEEMPPAGQYKSSERVGSRNGYYPKQRLIHTGDAVDYDGHQCHKDVWFNDEKERRIHRLNDHLGREYPFSRKRLDMDSNAFDFVDDNTGYSCPCAQVQTAKFQTTRFDNDCTQLNQQKEYVKVEQKKPKQQIVGKKTKQTVTFKVKQKQDAKKTQVPQTTGKITTKKEQISKKGTGITVNQTKKQETKEQVRQQKGTVKETPAGICTCNCQCWRHREGQKKI